VDARLDGLRPDDLVWVAYREGKGDERAAVEVRASSRRKFLQIRGVEDPLVAAEVHRLELLPGGQWFSEGGVEQLPSAADGKEPETAVQVVLGEASAQSLGAILHKERLEVGDVFELGPKKCKVVGILKSAGTIFGSEAWAKRSYIGDLYGKPANISSLNIRTASAAAAEELAARLKDYPKAKLNALTEPEYYSQQRTFLLILRTAIIVLTVFMALGGIFGVMNTMFAAISQRTKDIGVLRILGYARWQILASFLLESMVIALVGGLLGCALGALFNGRTATGIVGAAGGFGKSVQLSLIVDANVLALGVLLTLIMGLFGGLLPSLSAMRLKPLESLR
jgi:ABC-type antimicrobial peptide transport system permease subunit